MSDSSIGSRNGSKRTLGKILAIWLALWLAWGGATAPLLAAAKGSKIYKQARKLELQHQYDQALELYQKALAEDPENQIYELAMRRSRFAAAQAHVDKGHKLQDAGQLEAAAAEFEKAAAIDPSLSIASQELNRTRELIDKQKGRPAGEAKAHELATPAAEAKKEVQEFLQTVEDLPKLKPISTQPINLKISNNSKVIFETVAKLAGINVLFDPEYQDRRVSLELNNATLMEALDYVATIAKAYWKPLSSNAIFVTNDNATKRRDYEDFVVRTFYLTNAYTAQELQEIATAVRSVADIRRLFTINSLNALVVRGAADQVALAEKVINDVDKSRGEVIVDVMVLETSMSNIRDLGLTPVSNGNPGLAVPIGFTPRNPVLTGGSNSSSTGTTTSTTGTTTTGTTTTGTTGTTGTGTGTGATSAAIALGQISKVSTNDFSITLPGANLNAILTNSKSRLLQSPKVRGFDGYKASLRIGQRIPIATGSFQPGIGGVGINPLVNTQFNYQDVGVVLDLTPRIHLGKEVSMHIEIEISNVVNYVNIGGIQQPVIGQRKVIHDIRLKEGEAGIIGGLNQTQTTKSIAGVPGLSSIPLLGRLFSNEHTDVENDEVLIVLVPHVVRVPDLTDLNMREISAGTDQQVKLTYAPEKDDHSPLPPTSAEASPAPAAATPPVAPIPTAPAVETTPQATTAAPPAPSQAAAAAPPTPAVTSAAPATAPQSAPAPAGPTTQLRIDPPDSTVSTGGRVTLNLMIDNVTDLYASPLRISFNPKILHLTDVQRGGLVSTDAADAPFSKNIQNDQGTASINMTRSPGTRGVSGSGVLLVLQFEGAAAGRATVTVSNISATNSKLEPIPLKAVQADITVRDAAAK